MYCSKCQSKNCLYRYTYVCYDCFQKIDRIDNYYMPTNDVIIKIMNNGEESPYRF